MEKYLWELDVNQFTNDPEVIIEFSNNKDKVINILAHKNEMKFRDYFTQLTQIDDALYNILANERLEKNRFINILKAS
jgi:hypothetical protein